MGTHVSKLNFAFFLVSKVQQQQQQQQQQYNFNTPKIEEKDLKERRGGVVNERERKRVRERERERWFRLFFICLSFSLSDPPLKFYNILCTLAFRYFSVLFIFVRIETNKLSLSF